MDRNADKLWKKTLREQQKRFKPSECQKYVRLVMDPSICSLDFGAEFLTQLKNTQLKYILRQLPARQCIFWERNVGQRTLIPNASSDEFLDEEWQQERQVINLLSAQELQQAVEGGSIDSIGTHLHIAFPEKRHTIVLIGSYKDQKTASNISKAFIELQMLHEITTRRIEKNIAQELCQLLQRFTKAVAEVPHKQQKSKILNTFKKYLANDKKQCVRVEGTNGFGRLWQQHLNRLPLVTLEVAEAVIAQYTCPKLLLDEYNNNGADEAIKIIAELRIQRGGLQPLQTDRRIGKVLSTKLHTLYNSRDPNALI